MQLQSVDIPCCEPPAGMTQLGHHFPSPAMPTTSVVEAIIGPQEAQRPPLSELLRELGVRLSSERDHWPPGATRSSLGEILEALAQCRVRIVHADHLSDAELRAKLYTTLVVDALRCPPPGCHFELDFVDLSTPAGQEDYLRYYASEAERAAWRAWNPRDPLPARKPVPFPRCGR